MSLVSIVFFLAGRLCCRANFIFAADLTLRGQLKLTCLRHIDYKCNYFLSFLFLTGCSLSIFFGFGSRITAFIWWICTGKNSLHSQTVVGNEVVHQDEEVGGGGGLAAGAVNPREIWHFQVFKCQFAHSWISNMSQIPILRRTNTRSQDFMAALSISREQLLGEKWYPQTLCTSPSEQDIF